MNEGMSGSGHGFVSKERKGIEITGVKDVVSFDERGVALETTCGGMAVEGEELHVTTLDLTDGRVIVEGKINGTYYFDPIAQSKRGLFGGGKQKK